MKITEMKPMYIGKLCIPVPIIQGGMGVGISLSGMASAVANQGGVGVIASAGLGLLHRGKKPDFISDSIQGLKDEIRRFREKSNGIVGVNIMVAMSNFADMVRTSIAEKADIIFSGAGLPLDLPAFLKPGSHTKLVPIVSSARAAKIICSKWKQNYNYLPDAVVVEGPKAGGHLGFKKAQIDDESYALERLIPEVVSVVHEFETDGKQIPVIAAGGVYSGKDIANMQELGAAGVQMGTRFVTTTECDASDEFKQSYINSKKEDIEVIISPVGMPGRAIRNSFINKLNLGLKHPVRCPFKCIRSCDIGSTPYCIINALFNAFKGNFKGGYAFAGTNAYLAKKIISVQETFSEIRREYLAAK
jgi:NAD(P)H-dependent flavin oxidoreductase YrpB (nitropropane dioxygenase family)